jgi:endonuclease/exonuclease/phosphatase family metal-dependent hydrolase
MSFRIASYNIFKGGKNVFDQLAQAVSEIKADCIGLLEANGWGENNEKILKNFAKLTHYPFSYFAKANTNYDIICLNNLKPKNSTYFKNNFWHTALINIFQTNEIGEIAIVFIHFNPKTETERVAEIKALINILKPYPNAIILGDFNSLSPHDQYNQNELLTALKNKNITKFGSDRILFETITTIESAGFVDCAAHKNYFTNTVPTPANDDPFHAIPLRIDYAFATPKIIPFIKNITVKKGGVFDKASDHFPLILDMDLTVEN